MGHPEIRLLYITPESLFSRFHSEALHTAHRQKQIRRLVVDEVSCLVLVLLTFSGPRHRRELFFLKISLLIRQEWGMTFRPVSSAHLYYTTQS